MSSVQDYFIFDEPELERVGVVCPHCSTESVFDLAKEQVSHTGRECPGCGNSDFLGSFITEAKQSYNWVTYYKRVHDIKKKVGIRLYFKKHEDK